MDIYSLKSGTKIIIAVVFVVVIVIIIIIISMYVFLEMRGVFHLILTDDSSLGLPPYVV